MAKANYSVFSITFPRSHPASECFLCLWHFCFKLLYRNCYKKQFVWCCFTVFTHKSKINVFCCNRARYQINNHSQDASDCVEVGIKKPE